MGVHELCMVLGKKARELMDGMRDRAKRDPDVADFAAGFEPILTNAQVFTSHLLGDQERDIERLKRELDVTTRERDAYKKYVAKIVQIKAEYLLTQALPPIIIVKGDLTDAYVSPAERSESNDH